MDELTDQELLSRYTPQKNEEAFSQLVRRHLPVVFHTAHRQLGDHHLSEETAQTVFAILARKAGRLRTHPCLVAWLHRTAYFIARRTVRKEHRLEARMKSYQAQQTIACGPAEAKWDSEHRRFLDRALQRLPEIDQRILVLRFVESRSFGEISIATGKSEGTVRVRLHRALRKLSRWFEQRELPASDKLIAAGMGMLTAGKVSPSVAANVASGALEMAPDLGLSALLWNPVHPGQSFGWTAGTLTGGILLASATLVWQSNLHARLQEELALTTTATNEPKAAEAADGIDQVRPVPSRLIARLTAPANTITVEEVIKEIQRVVYLGAPKEMDDRLLHLDRPSLLRLVQEIADHPSPWNLKSVAEALRALACHDPREACEVGLRIGAGTGSISWPFRQWLRVDPVRATDWLEDKLAQNPRAFHSRSPGPDFSAAIIRYAAVAMIPHDGARAFEIIELIEGSRRPTQLAAFAGALIDHGTGATEALNAVSALLPEGKSNNGLIGMTIRMLADTGKRAQAKRDLDQWHDPGSRAYMSTLVDLTATLIDRGSDFQEGASWLLKQLPASRRPAAIRQFSRRPHDKSVLDTWLRKLPDQALRDQGIAGLVEKLTRYHPEEAREETKRIEDETLRNELLSRIDRSQCVIREFEARGR